MSARPLLLVASGSCAMSVACARLSADFDFGDAAEPRIVAASAQPFAGGVRVSWQAEGADLCVVSAEGPGVSMSEAVAGTSLTLALPAGEVAISVTPRSGGVDGPPSASLRVGAIPVGTAGLVPRAAPDWSVGLYAGAQRFGYPVQAAGDVDRDGYADLLVGAYQAVDGVVLAAGRLHLYRGGPAGLSTSASWVVSGTMSAENLGVAACVDDFDADGDADILVGSTGWSNGENSEGRIQLFLGAGGTFATTASVVTETNRVRAYLGRAISCVGDWSADGIADVFVGAPGWSNGQADEGLVALSFGGDPPFESEIVFEPNLVDAGSGFAISRVGDTDCDGVPEIAAGSFESGGVWVLESAPSGYSPIKTYMQGDSFGYSLDLADVNGDGCDDLLVGDRNANGGSGAAYVFHGSPAGLADAAAWTFTGGPTSNTGAAVASAGDLNGDGYEDVLVGAPRADLGQNDEGRAALFLGGPAGLSSGGPQWAYETDVSSARFGGSLDAVGDVNGDGAPDFAVGVFGEVTVSSTYGRAWVFHGPPAVGPFLDAGPPRTVDAGVPIAIGAAFSDPSGRAWTCEVDFGDGTPSATLTPCTQEALAGVEHGWNPGSWALTVRVTNDFGITSAATTRIESR